MTPERWSLVEELFARAADLHGPDRTELLDTATDGDPELRRAVERLLAEHDRDPSFLEAPPPWLAPATDPGADPGDAVPDRIGEYRILRSLGRGGMGQVYLAEREAPGFRQRVAIKLMRRGLDTEDVVRRFRNERQILASLDHPSIGRLLDLGATDDGLPYFVMEPVDGVSILEHCARRRLTVRQRLALFRTVCSAVQHAHQSLVVHRDLKPGNILVTEAGTPKLLDFGIAKILDPEDQASGQGLTRAGQRLLTPEYAAPEQLRGDLVTTACDVYALGILLYEMLAGRHPHAHDRPTAEELTRRILQVDPPAPSAVARDDALRRSLRGDLDTIVLRALRKEPDERYPSALSFSEDVRRYLAGLPVEARPATVRYRLRKFVRRNRLAVGAGVATFLLLVGFSGVTAYQSGRIAQEAARVARERDKAVEVRTFLLEMFGSTGPDQAPGATVSLRTLLDGRAATIGEAYAVDPELRAEMIAVLAESYERLGLFAEAEPLARDALQLRRGLFGDRHPDVAASLNLLGWVLHQRGATAEAERLLDDAVRVGRAVFPGDGDPRLARSLNDLGVIREAGGAYDQAEALYRESLDMRRRLLGDAHPGVAITTSNLAVVLYRQGDLDGAAEMAGRAVDAFRRALGPDHQRTGIALGNLAAIQSVRGDREAAADVYGQIMERSRRVLGPRHEQTAYAMLMRANQLVALDRVDQAEPLLEEALEISRETLGPDHPQVAQTLRVLGDVRKARADLPDALDRYLAALDLVRERVGDTHQEVALLELRVARTLDELGRPADAEPRYRRAVRTFRTTAGPTHYLTADATLALAEFLVGAGRADEAVPLIAELEETVASGDDAFSGVRDRLTAITTTLRRDTD